MLAGPPNLPTNPAPYELGALLACLAVAGVVLLWQGWRNTLHRGDSPPPGGTSGDRSADAPRHRPSPDPYLRRRGGES